jgi:manganese transport protein
MPEAEITATRQSAWRFFRTERGERPSLPEVNATVAVPRGAGWMRRLFASWAPAT